MKLYIQWLLLATTANILVEAGQFPVINGVLGGIGEGITTSSSSSTSRLLKAADVGDVRITRVVNQLRGVVENSGVCETTEGVYQASGYGDITENDSIWFWFFAARNNPDTAPLALWFNGGPGSSSMIGLTQEMGPCRINNGSDTVSLNPSAWNERVNMLYIDQPVGVGFSRGNKTVGTSMDAAQDIWTFMQIFLSDSRFSQFQNRDLAIWTESYGGHYGPAFASYFLSQNEAIAAGRINDGITLNLKTLGIGNGLTDALLQYEGIVNFGTNNDYRAFDSDAVRSANQSWANPGGCRDLITACYNNGTDRQCSRAQDSCNRNVVAPFTANINPYYTPNPPTDPYPRDPEAYLNSIASSIGADGSWEMTSERVYVNFAETGDWMRNLRPELERVINSGVRTLIYAGDADFIVNYQGIQLMVDALNTTFTEEYRQQEYQTYLVNGIEAGSYKNAGTFSYLRVFGAGHEVPAYTIGNLPIGQVALQMFNQIMANQSLSNEAVATTTENNSGGDTNSALSVSEVNILGLILMTVTPIASLMLLKW